MAQYTEILHDGTRRTVKYNPHHDGPVSDLITLANKARWLQHWCRRHPGDHARQRQLSRLRRKLPARFFRTPSPATANVNVL